MNSPADAAALEHRRRRTFQLPVDPSQKGWRGRRQRHQPSNILTRRRKKKRKSGSSRHSRRRPKIKKNKEAAKCGSLPPPPPKSLHHALCLQAIRAMVVAARTLFLSCFAPPCLGVRRVVAVGMESAK